MFVFGETKELVRDGKLILSKEFNLMKKYLICKWKNERTLYISDNVKSLEYAAGKNTLAIW